MKDPFTGAVNIPVGVVSNKRSGEYLVEAPGVTLLEQHADEVTGFKVAWFDEAYVDAGQGSHPVLTAALGDERLFVVQFPPYLASNLQPYLRSHPEWLGLPIIWFTAYKRVGLHRLHYPHGLRKPVRS